MDKSNTTPEQLPPATGSNSLDDYLSDCFKRGVIDHAIRANVDEEGRISFYIHPVGVDGQTLDFWVWDNCLWDQLGMHPSEVSRLMVECAKDLSEGKTPGPKVAQQQLPHATSRSNRDRSQAMSPNNKTEQRSPLP